MLSSIYRELKIDTSNLGCVSLNVEPLPISIDDLGGSKILYYSDDKKWINGYINSHITLLYGLLPNVQKKHVDFIVDDIEKPTTIKIKNIDFFSNPKEPYVCIIANVYASQILKYHKKLCMLPHINTRSTYKVHITIAYIKKENCTRELINKLNRLCTNIEIKTKDIIFE
jgi:2'-5' RNA ligase